MNKSGAPNMTVQTSKVIFFQQCLIPAALNPWGLALAVMDVVCCFNEVEQIVDKPQSAVIMKDDL